MDGEQMNLDYLLQELMEINGVDSGLPTRLNEKKYLIRSLMNITPPHDLSQEYYTAEAAYLQNELSQKHITGMDEIHEKIGHKIFLWQGDITTLQTDAITNAANNALLGCFHPHHNCIDNAIHSASGLALRNACHAIMTKQGSKEATGGAKITRGYNLPSKFVIHTVGPIVDGPLTQDHKTSLKNCYLACLSAAGKHESIRSMAFCSISTGVFNFPKEQAAAIALETITHYMNHTPDALDRVIVNVFSEDELNVYRKVSSADQSRSGKN